VKRSWVAVCLVVGVCVLSVASASARAGAGQHGSAGGNGKGLALGRAQSDGPAAALAHAKTTGHAESTPQSSLAGSGGSNARNDGSNANGGGQGSGTPAGSTPASGGSGDFSYVANPPAIRGPAVSALSGPHLPGVGNHCAALVGATGPLACYDPTQIRNAYDIPSSLTGVGQTIVIVVAYGDPIIEQDLAAFDSVFGLPDPPSFTVYNGSSTLTAGPHEAAGWALETALDVEWAHAVAPGANIVLVEAPSSSGNAITSWEKRIVPKYPGSILSQSFGINENALTGNGNDIHWKQAHANYQRFAQLGITVLASAGDEGATGGTASNTPSYPASDPWVTGVGGTQGSSQDHPFPYGLCPSDTSDACVYGAEEVWNEPATIDVPVATGGALSQLFGSPSYQSGLGYGARATPDVAFNAALNGGVLVIQGPFAYIVGGTSAGTAQWAGIFALVNEARANAGDGPIGFANPALYGIYGDSTEYANDFHDIVSGNNTLAGAPVSGYSAATGYDLATGLGTPDVANLIADLR
jgi:subtilase family serine protease